MYADASTVRTLCRNILTQIDDALIDVAGAWVNVELDALLSQVFYWPVGSNGVMITPTPAAIVQVANFMTACLVEGLYYAQVVGPEADGLIQGPSTWGKYLTRMAQNLLDKIIAHTAFVKELQPQLPVAGQNVTTQFRLEQGLAYVSNYLGGIYAYGNLNCGRA